MYTPTPSPPFSLAHSPVDPNQSIPTTPPPPAPPPPTPTTCRAGKRLFALFSDEFLKDEYVVQSIGLLPDLIIKIFSFLNPQDLFNISQTCRYWSFLFKDEVIWERVSQSYRLAEDKPPDSSWIDWCKQIFDFGVFDTKRNVEWLSYSKDRKFVKKSDLTAGYADVSIALVGWPLKRGRVYVEFDMKTKGDEYFFGVTHRPEEVVKVKGPSIIRHPLTWAYTCGFRYGIWANGQSYPADPFKIGDRIGVYLNLDSYEVSFFRNGVLQGQAFSLLTGEQYQIFAMLDSENDQVQIIRSYVGPLRTSNPAEPPPIDDK